MTAKILRSLHSAIICSVLAAIGISSSALAATVYENPWNSLAPDGGGFSHFSQRLAGQFVLGAGTNVNRATWYGTMFSADPLNTGDTWNFNVIFYSNAASLPGAVLSSAAVSAAVTDTGVNIGGERAYLFDASFADVALLGATSYWFSALNTDIQTTFRWTGATAGLLSAISLDGINWNPSSQEGRTPLNFALYDGGAVNVVPIPAALPLFATGLGALGLLGWRRKRTGAATVAA